MEGFIAIVFIIYIIINICSCIMYSRSYESFFDFVFSSLIFGIIGLPGVCFGIIGRKIHEDNKISKWEAEEKRRKEEEKIQQEKERTIRETKSKEIQKQLEIRALQIEQSQMFKKLLSFITETETPNQIDIGSEQVTIYLNGKTKTFDYLLNGIENIKITKDKDDDSRNSDLYALAFAVSKNINANYTINPERKFNKWADYMFYETTKVTLKRKLPSIV